MPAQSFAIDSWASRLLFLGVSNGNLRRWFEDHRCLPRAHSFLIRWQLGVEFTSVEFQCSNCHQIQGMAVRTPFSIFEDPIPEYLREGWPELTWESPIAAWQLRHREHVVAERGFTLTRNYTNGRLTVSLVCPCGGVSGASAGWPLEPQPSPTVPREPRDPNYQPSALEVSEIPKVSKSLIQHERLVRHRATGLIYRLPAFTLSLEPVEGETQTLSCSVENLWFEFDRFFGGEDPNRNQTWHERLAKG